MLVDIIIRAKNGHDMVERLLDSIDQNTPEPHRIILVDDGSEPDLDFEVDYNVRSSKSQGAVTATNLGLAISLAHSDSEYTLIMDNDTEIPAGDKGWLARFIAELEEAGPQTACVGATSDAVNPPQQILAVPTTYTADWESPKDNRSGMKDNPPAVWFVSFCVLFRKSVLRELGPWDEQYNPGNWEDTDYAVQVREAGYSIRVARSVYIHHHCHQTFGKDLKTLLVKNQEKFAEKWGIGRLWDLGIINHREIAIVAGRQAGILKEETAKPIPAKPQ